MTAHYTGLSLSGLTAREFQTSPLQMFTKTGFTYLLYNLIMYCSQCYYKALLAYELYIYHLFASNKQNKVY